MQVFTVSIIVERIRWLETECVQNYEKTWQLVTMEMIREADFDVQTVWWSRKKTAIGTLFIFIPFYYVSWLDGLRCFRRCFHFIQHIATQSINQTIGFCQITMIITISTLHNTGEGFAYMAKSCTNDNTPKHVFYGCYWSFKFVGFFSAFDLPKITDVSFPHSFLSVLIGRYILFLASLFLSGFLSFTVCQTSLLKCLPITLNSSCPRQNVWSLSEVLSCSSFLCLLKI